MTSWICLAVAGICAALLVASWRKQRQLESSLAKSRAEAGELNSVIELFEHPVILTTPEGGILRWNRAAERLYGYAAAEVLRKPVSSLLAPDAALQLPAFFEKIRQGETCVRCETLALSKNGPSVDVTLAFTPIKNAAGHIAGVCVFSYDISKRIRAEEALARERYLVETLMENIPDHIYFKNRESRFLRISKSMAHSFKLNDPSEAIGKTDFDFFLAEHARQAFEDEQQIIRTGQSLVGREEKETWPDGSVTWASTTKLCLRDAQGGIIGTFGISRDITDRKLAEDALALKTQELVRSNTDLEHFAYAASHDLQEPLRMIASYLQLLTRRCQHLLSPEGKEFIGFAVDGAKRMQNLINDLLMYSRVGRRGKPFAPVECAEVLQRVLANLQLAIQDTGAVVTHDPLPQVIGDMTQLTQLFQNLIGNAIKFHGQEPPRIHIKAESRKAVGPGLAGKDVTEWVFSVRDNGIGIEPQYFERIFIIFQRLHTREKYPGTGIGLAVCKRIVERHGGQIWVESHQGQGSTFYFTIVQMEPQHA